MINVRIANDSDKEQLFSLYTEWDENHIFDKSTFMDSFGTIINSTRNYIFIAEEKGNFLGYIQLYIINNLGFEPFYEVSELLVSKMHRGKGVGKLLMKKAEEVALREEIPFVKLSSQVKRSPAHVFYESIGYSFYKISKFYEKRLESTETAPT